MLSLFGGGDLGHQMPPDPRRLWLSRSTPARRRPKYAVNYPVHGNWAGDGFSQDCAHRQIQRLAWTLPASYRSHQSLGTRPGHKGVNWLLLLARRLPVRCLR